MTPLPMPSVVNAVLRLLLDRREAVPTDAPWDEWAPVLERNAVLLRVVDRLETLGWLVPIRLSAAALRERDRVERVLRLMRQVANTCERHGIPHLFPKALLHYPDAGSDIDLLVPVPSAADTLILAGAPAAPYRIDFSHLVSASRVYRVGDAGLTLDIHHGRVGQLGEHRELAARLIAGRRPQSVAGAEWWVATPEDALVLQGLDRVAGRRSFRLADIVNTVRLVRDGVDWDAVERTARATGVLPWLSCYLAYVSQIHREVLGRDLTMPTLGTPPVAAWGRAAFHGGLFHFPAVRVSGGVYARAFGSAVAHARWGGAGRLLLFPILAGAALWRRATHTLAAAVTHLAILPRSEA